MKRVLIVDDAIFMRTAIRKMIENNGFEIVGEAVNGVEGLHKYKELKPDIVTMDITMPDMNGIEALKAIKAYDSKAKVIMMSAIGQENYVKEAILSGASDFIVKPFNEKTVTNVLEKIN